MDRQTHYLKLQQLDDSARAKEPMGRWTSFRCGGEADLLLVPADEETLRRDLAYIHENDIPYFILGNGTNVLVKDGGFAGVMLVIGEAFSSLSSDADNPARITAGGGALMSALAAFAQKQGLSGLEFAGGIPGSVGGGVYMNAGAYDGEIKQVLASVRLQPLDGGAAYDVPASELDLAYRHSRLMEEGAIVLSATFELAPKDPSAIQATMEELATRRRDKQPLEYPSCGSFFKRPPGHFAGKLVEEAGCKGLSVGDAQISPKHGGFLINLGDATATDILTLMHLVQARVLEQTGITLEPEVRIIGDD